MATKKRTASGASRAKSGSSGKRGTGRKGSGGRFDGGVPPEVLGAALIAVGLFLTVAFVTGSGAFLGDAGRLVLTRIFGVAGLVLAPIAVVAGFFLLIRRFSWRRWLGVGLIFLGVVTGLASRLPVDLRYVPEAYSSAGGIVGSGIYGAIFVVAGTVGVVIVLTLAFVVGASLVSGVTFRQAYERLTAGYDYAGEVLEDRKRDRQERREEREREEREREERERKDAEAREVPVEEIEEKPVRKSSKRKRTGDEKSDEYAVSGRAQGVDELYAELEDGLARVDEPPKTGVGEEVEPVEDAEAEFEVIVPRQRDSSQKSRSREILSGEYKPPPFSILSRGTVTPEHDAGETSKRLTRALADLGVEATVVRAVVGPRVTRYELRLGSGVKVGKVSNLQQDIAYALAATEVRILAPIPGKSAVGVEVPNLRPAKVTLGDVFDEYPESNDWALPVGLGKDIAGRAVFMNLAEMPHLLVAGTTGSGKSVMLNGLLTSLLLTTDPRQVKLVLIDPKRVEMAPFAKVPHLITPVVTDVKKAANALSWAVSEMERRYEVLEKMGVRSLDGYNAKADTQMPYVVIVIDELADLMMTAAAKVEDAVIRIAQKARAVGIHLVVATQRPSVDVITGMIKANVPSRIAFAVSSQVDSRVILDTPGAEALLGMGDMLFKPVSASRPSRVQGAFIAESEVEDIVEATVAASRGNVEAEFIDEVVEPTIVSKETDEPEDDLIPEAANFVVATQQASVSAVQRRFRVGYSRAGRIIDALERKGVVGPYEGSKSRSVVATEADLASIFNWNAQEKVTGRTDDGETW